MSFLGHTWGIDEMTSHIRCLLYIPSITFLWFLIHPVGTVRIFQQHDASHCYIKPRTRLTCSSRFGFGQHRRQTAVLAVLFTESHIPGPPAEKKIQIIHVKPDRSQVILHSKQSTWYKPDHNRHSKSPPLGFHELLLEGGKDGRCSYQRIRIRMNGFLLLNPRH